MVRLVTPGTLTEETLLEPARANWLLALARTRGDTAKGEVGAYRTRRPWTSRPVPSRSATCRASRSAARSAASIRARSSSPTRSPTTSDVKRALAETRAPVTRLGREPGSSERRLLDFFGLATLEGLGGLSKAEIAAAATAVFYLERTQCGARPKLEPPLSTRRTRTMEIDAATRANLELTRTLAGRNEGSLLATIDRCATPAGSRRLAAQLAAPLTDPAPIEARLGSVAAFVAARELRADVRAILKGAPDLSRAVSRLALERAGPRDLAAVGAALGAARDVAGRLADDAFPTGPLPAPLAGARAAAAAVDPASAAR